MSTQLSNLVYDLEHNALLAKQFMYSHESLVANYEIPSAEKLLLAARNLSDLNTLGPLQNSSELVNQLDIASELCTKTCTVKTCHHNPNC